MECTLSFALKLLGKSFQEVPFILEIFYNLWQI